MSRLPPDPGDVRRRLYLEAVLARMEASSAEEARIREGARRLLALKREKRLASEAFLGRWDTLLALPVAELRTRLLDAGAAGRELRHSHLFSGALPVEQANEVFRRGLARDITGP